MNRADSQDGPAIVSRHGSLWFEKVLALRPLVDLAGVVNQENIDASCRERIAAAFYDEDIDRYCDEVKRFIQYCFEDVIVKKFLSPDSASSYGLGGMATFYTRVPYVFEDQLQNAKYVVSVFGFNEPSLVNDFFASSSSPVPAWFCHGNRCDQPCFDKELNPDCCHAVLTKTLLKDDYAFVPFYNALPSRFSLSLELANLSAALDHPELVFATLMAGREKLKGSLKNLDVSLAAITTRTGQQFNGGLSSLFSSLEGVSPTLLEQATRYVIGSWDKVFGFNNPALSLFDFDPSYPELTQQFVRNREWLEKNEQIRLSDFLGMAASFLLVPGASHLHCFHFGLGHEEELPSKIDGASGVMVLYDCMERELSREDFYGIQFLMQSCMSSLAILESELIQSHLVMEKRIAEKAQFILRKLHHALSGPITVAFNRFALRYDKMIQQVEGERDREALTEVYAIMKSARAQVVSWSAFSNPEGIQDKRVATQVDLRHHVETALSLLFSGKDQRAIELSPQSEWLIEGNLDMGLIDVLIWQLLRNAREHLFHDMTSDPDDGSLRVEFERAQGFWFLCISNKAPDFSSTAAIKIIDNLRLGKINKSTKPNGQGLGLLTCHEITGLHRGEFVVDAIGGRFCARLKIPC